MIAGSVAAIGICTVCAEAYGLRVDGSMRTHGWQHARAGNCPGSRRAPATGDTPLPDGIPQCGTWTGQVACRAHDPEWWFATDPATARAAKAICRACEVRALCLEWSLDIGATDGVWGGMDPAQRKSLARRRAAPVDDGPDHGTLNRYRGRGCRCTDCREAHRIACADERARRAERLVDAPHGLASTYQNWRCRCAECTRANTEYIRDRSQRRRARP